MLTTRDFDVIDFVKEFRVADTDIISDLFFPSLQMCQRRLKIIVDNNKLHRARDSINQKYIYYQKVPKQLNHSLLVTKFYHKLNTLSDVPKFKVEPIYDNIRPDAAFVYLSNGTYKVGLLEVELSNKGFDWNKYIRFCSNDNYKQFMTLPPTIFIVSNKVKPISVPFDYRILDINLSCLSVI